MAIETASKTAASAAPVPGAVPDQEADNLTLQRIYHWEKYRAKEIFLTQPIQGQIRDWTWEEAVDESRRMAAWLRAQHFPAGSHIAILSKNSAWWIMADIAIWMAGHASVAIYGSLTAAGAREQLEHSDSVACFLGHTDDKHITPDALPPGIKVIALPTIDPGPATPWDSIIEATPPMEESPVRGGDEVATIMYTSGTTGAPKGARHRFRSFTGFASAVTRVVGSSPDERMLSYLPLAHIAERALLEAAVFHNGFRLYFVETLETFRADLRRARPTIFFSVPRLLLKFQQGVYEKVPRRKLERLLKIPILNNIVRKKIVTELGLDKTHLAASGSAALPMDTLMFFRSLGLNMVEGYGMTETGITHTPKNGRSRPGFVGDAAPGVEVKIAENGEVLVRSSMNLLDYYKNPGALQGAMTEDGYFRTGDLGEVDPEGWLKITGRVKEQFKTSKGKYISPSLIEKQLSVHPAVEGCCVMGENMPQPFGMVTAAARLHSIGDDKAQLDAFAEEMKRLLTQVNASLEPWERMAFLVVTDEHWTVSNGFLTPTLKLKRSVLEGANAIWFEEWARRGTPIVLHLTRHKLPRTHPE
ncbi:MAG TPA: AMP-binding acetyl-CoA synthetase [Solibacterales bacterium]|nr:AMP-binding acetyl-CoA synthetase [Bryobacterales bacterium]